MTLWSALVDFFGTLILGVTALCVFGPLLEASGRRLRALHRMHSRRRRCLK